jgi:hypothetical protein
MASKTNQERVPAPAAGPSEVRGVRPSDEGGSVFTYEVSQDLATGKRYGSYRRYIVRHVDDRVRENGRVAVVVSRVFDDGTWYRDGFGKTLYLVADGGSIELDSDFDQPVMTVAPPA